MEHLEMRADGRNDYVLSPLWTDLFPEGLLGQLRANPFLVACRNGAVSVDQLRHFLIQHHYYSQYFTRYLCALMGSLADQGEFKALSHNLTEELSGGDSVDISHAELYRRGMDLMAAVPRSRPPLEGTRQLIDAMFRHCRSSDPLDGLAALCLGAEAIVPLIYGPVLDALRSHNAPAEAEHFFVLHIEEDEEHAIVMRDIIDRMLGERPYLRSRVIAIGEEMIHLRMDMLAELVGQGSGTGEAQGTLTSPEALQALRADASLGSANFLDRCLALSTTADQPFLFLDRPLQLLQGAPVTALGLNDLQRHRMALADWYLQQGVKPGDVVAVSVEDGLMPMLHYLALTSLGAAISLMNPAMPAEFGLAYMAENGFERLVTDSSTLATSAFAREWCNQGPQSVLDVSLSRLDPAPELPTWWPLEPEDSTLVMLSHTSGTTGLPKAVRFEHRQFFMGKRARIGRFAEGPDERLLTALPQSHSAAISHLETAVLHGIPTYVLGTQDGHALREAIRHFQPTTVVAFPRSYVLLVDGGIRPGEFPGVRRWFAMGDASHQSHVRAILDGAPQSRFIDAFGSSELGMALFRSESTREALADQRSIGRPVDIALAKVLDPCNGEEVKPGEVGLLAVRSPTVTSGYWKQSQKTAEAWRAGYFLTGDVAYCRDGEFFQIDRAVDVIDARDGALYTLLLEEAAQQVEGVCDATVVGVDPSHAEGTRVLALVLPERQALDQAAAIAPRVLTALYQAATRRGVHLSEGEVAVAVVSDLAFLPAGATGKILKRRLRGLAETLLAGQHEQALLHLLRRTPEAEHSLASSGTAR